MKSEAFAHMGCSVVPECHPARIYFGVFPKDDGYETDFLRVMSLDRTWVRCDGPADARRYIDVYLDGHMGGRT
jgi:hypothetical protein